ncbi:MAG: hypothetical protein ACR2QW_10690 [bacterium]
MRVKLYQLICSLVGLVFVCSSHANVTFEVCFDFGCKSRGQVSLSAGEWSSVSTILNAATAVGERKRIKRAIAWMEILAGQYTPTHRDLGGNLLSLNSDVQVGKLSGQLDCIDESINTKRYLDLFVQAGLLKFHAVTGRVYRRSFLTQHWAVQIEEVRTGRRFVVDSWFEDNGKLPVLVSSETWHDLSL